MDEATAARNTAAVEAALTQGYEVAQHILDDLAAILARIDHTPGAHVADALLAIVDEELPQLSHPWRHNNDAVGALAAALWPSVAAAGPQMELRPAGRDDWQMTPNDALATAGSAADLALRAAGAGMVALEISPLLLIAAAALAANRAPVRRHLADVGGPLPQRRPQPARKAAADVAHGGPATIPTQRVA